MKPQTARPIKFRGKRTDTKAWVYGSLLQSEIDVNGKCYCAITERFAHDNDLVRYDVIPETVGQAVGLNDENGKEIYEGDIIELSLGLYGTHRVEWNDDTCQFQTSNGVPLNDGENYGISKLITGTIHDEKP